MLSMFDSDCSIDSELLLAHVWAKSVTLGERYLLFRFVKASKAVSSGMAHGGSLYDRG